MESRGAGEVGVIITAKVSVAVEAHIHAWRNLYVLSYLKINNLTSLESTSKYLKVTRKGQLQCSGEADNFLIGKIAREVNMSEPDSDVVRWGLHFLDVDQIFNSNYDGDNSQGDGSICHDQYTRDNNYDTECSNVENDEIIAHALQEELSQLSIEEASESSHAGEEHLQASTIAPDWLSPSSRNHYSGYEGGQAEAEAEDMGPSSSCSSPGGKSYDGEEYSYNLEIADDSALDGEVGKRLHEIIPVPHVPRINGEIPTIDEATSDHQRLLDSKLESGYYFADCNCMTWLSIRLKEMAIVRVSSLATSVKAMLAMDYRLPWARETRGDGKRSNKMLKSHREMYEGYVPMEYGDYLKKMSKSGEWGDHVTLQAAADSYPSLGGKVLKSGCGCGRSRHNGGGGAVVVVGCKGRSAMVTVTETVNFFMGAVVELLHSWPGTRVGKRRMKRCNAAPLCLMWPISGLRNYLSMKKWKRLFTSQKLFFEHYRFRWSLIWDILLGFVEIYIPMMLRSMFTFLRGFSLNVLAASLLDYCHPILRGRKGGGGLSDIGIRSFLACANHAYYCTHPWLAVVADGNETVNLSKTTYW
ncbi:hypothetical protein TEA_029933 [Camellia sinensis var. sinensis]|uniref:Uncharacterized protein n=1 Tax=Camellia sinensis var. sinensis TaxID=542762 RepID=A0A4S4EIU3_CAMSN|nr:hypothetical protein TEA_029933 [Camellia sinensis var. sinensis]